MGAANGDRHSTDAHRQRIAPKRAGMKRFDGHAFVEAKLAKAAGIAGIEQRPVDRGDARRDTGDELIKGQGIGHLRAIIINSCGWLVRQRGG